MYLGSPRQIPSISIHAPREGSDAWGGRPPGRQYRFLSTLPVRGATWKNTSVQKIAEISIHAPREGSDLPFAQKTRGCAVFLSTLPVRGATIGGHVQQLDPLGISIHAPREGSDPTS